mgnify:CR=1 FL=1
MSMVMKKLITKAVAAAIPLLMVFPVMAAGFDGVSDGSSNTVAIPKGIIIQNNGYTQCYTPHVTFNYTATPVTVADGTMVTDTNGTSGGVQSGVAGGVSSTVSLTFESNLISESDDSEIAVPKLAQELVGNIEFTINVDAFSGPGIYRYEITDVTPIANLYNEGIQRPEDFDTTRTLDVYIESDGQGGLQVAGYVLTDIEGDSITPATDKDPGYATPATPVETAVPGYDIPGFEVLGNTATNAMGENGMDVYMSYNFDVTKIITGDMADVNHDFPFTITLADLPDGITTSANVFAGTDATSALLVEGTEFTAALSNGEVYHVYGANPFYAATIAERNDTRSPYKVTIPGTDYNATVVNPNDSAFALINVSNYASVNSTTNVSGAVTDNGDVNVTNNLDGLDPTGLRSGMTPYIIFAALAAAGVAAGCIISIKKKSTDSSES